MSRTLESPETSATATSAADFVPNEFGYRPVPVLAPVSLCLGLASAIGMLGLLGLVIPLAGTILGILCLVKIVRSEGEYGGFLPTVLGLGLSAFFLLFGTAFHAYAIATEVPEGYERINFSRDLSQKKILVLDGEPAIHPEVAELDGRKIFLKGYMYPTGKLNGLTEFILVKDNQQCCFGGQPELTDMIRVRMQGDVTADYARGLVGVAGVFRVLDPRTGGALQPIYELEGFHFARSRTPFR